MPLPYLKRKNTGFPAASFASGSAPTDANVACTTPGSVSFVPSAAGLLIAGEIIREKALRLLQEEVPHGIAVTIDSMKYRKKKDGTDICDIDASIICERESHKLIVIGKQGAMLKKIGTAARTDIENMLQCKVNLKLWVKVRKDWKDNEQQMKSFGYDIRKYKK